MTAAQPLAGLSAIDVTSVHASSSNPREHLTGIDDLALSIREAGLLQPIIVQKVPGRDGFQIIAGHRRYAAVRKLGWAKVPAIIRRDLLPDEELLAMVVENGQRSDLDPIEEGRAYKRLVGMGLSHADVARRVGRSKSTIAGRIALLSLPPHEQEEIRAGVLAVTRVLDRERAERQEERVRAAGRPVGRPKGAKTKPYFSDTHPLAAAARALCAPHWRGRVKVSGGVACGECWEQAIREAVLTAAADEVGAPCAACGVEVDPDGVSA